MLSATGGVRATTLHTSLLMNEATATNEAVAVAVLSKGQDIEKATGEAALRLIDSATAQKIDVYV